LWSKPALERISSLDHNDRVTLGRSSGLLGLIFLVLAVPLLLASSAAAANSHVFHDPLGDVSCCTRDLTDIRVANTDAGTITFDAHFDDTVEGNDDDDMYLFLDTDRDPMTGQLGADYMIGAHIQPGRADSQTLSKWDGVAFRQVPAPGLKVSVVAKQILISFDRHLVGDTDGFNFQLALWEVTSLGGAHSELAPNSGTWFFPVELDLRRLHPRLDTTPAHPRAGRLLIARLALGVGRTRSLLASGRVLCAASARGVALHARFSAFAGRRAVCSWLIPHGTRGATLGGSVGVAATTRSRIYRHFSIRIE
jgi:hypothetical protein